ncbi:MAG: T9SS C-terminal target domain-containing protein [Bacteroidetes bacterium]|nr:T9SS C-terminal target domain-containing protein [Bacteroidota bacterium]
MAQTFDGRLEQNETSLNLKSGIYFVILYNGNSQITSKIYIDEI